MPSYRDLVSRYENTSDDQHEVKVEIIRRILEKVDHQMDLKLTNKTIHEQLTIAGIPGHPAWDMIHNVEIARAKRTKLGRLLYE